MHAYIKCYDRSQYICYTGLFQLNIKEALDGCQIRNKHWVGVIPYTVIRSCPWNVQMFLAVSGMVKLIYYDRSTVFNKAYSVKGAKALIRCLYQPTVEMFG